MSVTLVSIKQALSDTHTLSNQLEQVAMQLRKQELTFSALGTLHDNGGVPGVIVSALSKAKFSSTQVEPFFSIAEAVRGVAWLIADADLTDDGREEVPHITVKYGIHTDNVNEVREALRREPPVQATLGKVTYFANVEEGTADAVLIEVISDDLKRLNEQLTQKLETTSTHPDYKPHMTIAYVKPGLGEKYAQRFVTTFEGVELKFSDVFFSSRNKVKSRIALTGAPLRNVYTAEQYRMSLFGEIQRQHGVAATE